MWTTKQQNLIILKKHKKRSNPLHLGLGHKGLGDTLQALIQNLRDGRCDGLCLLRRDPFLLQPPDLHKQKHKCQQMWTTKQQNLIILKKHKKRSNPLHLGLGHKGLGDTLQALIQNLRDGRCGLRLLRRGPFLLQPPDLHKQKHKHL